MKVQELNKVQLEELKQRYYTEKNENVSYGELADIDNLVSDKEIFEEYEGIEFTEDDFFSSENLTDELLNNDYTEEITQNSDLGHGEILDIAKLLIYYCKENLKEDIFINGYTQYKDNYEDLCKILKDLQNNIVEHNKIGGNF